MEAARSQKLGPAGHGGAFFFLEEGIKRKDAKTQRINKETKKAGRAVL